MPCFEIRSESSLISYVNDAVTCQLVTQSKKELLNWFELSLFQLKLSCKPKLSIWAWRWPCAPTVPSSKASGLLQNLLPNQQVTIWLLLSSASLASLHPTNLPYSGAKYYLVNQANGRRPQNVIWLETRRTLRVQLVSEANVLQVHEEFARRTRLYPAPATGPAIPLNENQTRITWPWVWRGRWLKPS